MRSPLSHTVVPLVILLVAFTSRVDAVRLTACGARLREQQAKEWNATHDPTEPPPPLSLSYEQCLVECGAGLGDVNWRAFSQSFSAWLLPWIALMFQIPFGAEEPFDDVLSFFITIGSPALAAYSLQITHLNTRWLSKAFMDIKFPNSKSIPTVISAFHHVPIKISSHPSLLPSLIVLPQNDGYWNILLRGAKKARRWSVPLIMNFVWVVFAALLTIVDSFYSPVPGDVGYAIVAVWTFLLPLIIGWLHVGCEPEPNHLRECLEGANLIAWVATDQRDRPVPAESVARHQALAFEFVKADDVPPARKDELKTIPVFNYSRVFIWSQNAEWLLALVKNAASNAEQKIPVGGLGGERHSVWVKNEGGNMANENRVGTSFQVTQYCTMVFPPLEPEVTGKSSLGSFKTFSTVDLLLPYDGSRQGVRNSSRWGAGVWRRVILAVVLALGLQWGTTGAAVIIHYWKRPVGLGCRALSFLLYSMAGTTSFFLFLASSILAHLTRPQPGRPHFRSRSLMFLDAGAILCRWLGKVVAILSAMGILLVCFFQATGAFNTCFCASTTFDKGKHPVVFLTINYVLGPTLSMVWIGGLVMAFSTAVLFGFSIYLGTPPCR